MKKATMFKYEVLADLRAEIERVKVNISPEKLRFANVTFSKTKVVLRKIQRNQEVGNYNISFKGAQSSIHFIPTNLDATS